MKYIGSKNICLLIRDTLKLTDRRLTDHDSRVAYIVYKMLEATGRYEKFELAELTFIASIHNIGAYQTDDVEELLKPGFKDVVPHSIYGYLFIKYLFPVPEYDKILLYHHTNYNQMGKVDYEFKNIAYAIRLADDMESAISRQGDQFDYRQFEKDIFIKYDREAYECFIRAQFQFQVLERLTSGEYKQELDDLMEFVLFRNDEKKKYLEMLMYCIGFRNNYGVVDAITTICISEEIGKKMGLTQEEQDILYYGSLMHDIGMLVMPRDLVDAPRQLTAEERALLRTHVPAAEKILRQRFRNQEIVDVAVRHHERLDGSGYPSGMKAKEMKKLDKILQIADVVTALTNKRSYHEPKSKGEVYRILSDESRSIKLDSSIIDVFLRNYDEIMERVKKESEAILVTYSKLRSQYNIVRSRL